MSGASVFCMSGQQTMTDGARQKTAAEVLATPVQFVPGVGPRRAALLARLGLNTASDLIFNFPRDYEDLTDLRPISALQEGKVVSVHATVEEAEQRVALSGKSVLGVLVRQGRDYLRAIWFNMPYLREQFRPGQQVLLSGEAKYSGGRWEMIHPKYQFLDPDEEPPKGAILPVYSLTEGLRQGEMRRAVRGALEMSGGFLDEVFPAEYLAGHRLWPIRGALPQIHFPESRENLAHARRRFVYQELFVLQLALAVKRRLSRERGTAPVFEATALIDARIRRLLPFELTAGQREVIAEIAADVARGVPMNRLLHGEVGSGKTVVAVYAMLLVAAHRHQAVLMAPTEVLARQHEQTLHALLSGSQVRIGVLTGGQSASERRDLLERIAAGDVDLVVGTQAILLSGVQFARLGLVVIDEQHKFGVRQRAELKAAGGAPHYLVMTATPIPRTISMTLFGDLDVSVLREAPPNRQRVHTYLVLPDQAAKWWDFFRRKLTEGRQGYVITPLVEESEHVPGAGVEEAFETLRAGELRGFRVGLVHGRMSGDEKQKAMDDFRAGHTQALVATSVVEVGVDVPNATLLTIHFPQWFGLAQLHQLRGRISRGSHPGYCGVLAEANATPESQARLEAFVRHSDGFELAEIDFQLRGPGDLLGTRQHGLPPLRIADLRRDTAVLEEARRDAQELIAADPGLARPEHALLRKMMLRRYGRSLELGDVG